MADDHTLFRQGLVSLLADEPDLEVVGEATSGEEALELAHVLRPDLVLMDVRMPGMSGVEATRRLLSELPGLKVIILTVSEDDEDLFGAIEAGARGYVLKNADAEELLRAIRQVHAGRALVSPAMTLRILEALRTGQFPLPREIPLTPREQEVLRLLVQGATNREIARALTISENTVKTHVRHILEKLGLQNRSQVAAYTRMLRFLS